MVRVTGTGKFTKAVSKKLHVAEDEVEDEADSDKEKEEAKEEVVDDVKENADDAGGSDGDEEADDEKNSVAEASTKPRCDCWCQDHKDPWAEKCSWDLLCASCDMCAREVTCAGGRRRVARRPLAEEGPAARSVRSLRPEAMHTHTPS